MACGTGNSDIATGSAEASSYEYLKVFYEQISADSNGKNVTYLCKLCLRGLKKKKSERQPHRQRI